MPPQLRPYKPLLRPRCSALSSGAPSSSKLTTDIQCARSRHTPHLGAETQAPGIKACRHPTLSQLLYFHPQLVLARLATRQSKLQTRQEQSTLLAARRRRKKKSITMKKTQPPTLQTAAAAVIRHQAVTTTRESAREKAAIPLVLRDTAKATILTTRDIRTTPWRAATTTPTTSAKVCNTTNLSKSSPGRERTGKVSAALSQPCSIYPHCWSPPGSSTFVRPTTASFSLHRQYLPVERTRRTFYISRPLSRSTVATGGFTSIHKAVFQRRPPARC